MSIGAKRHRISILRHSTEIDKDGFPTSSWVEVKKLWASASSLYGKEFYEASKVNAQNDVNFQIRMPNFPIDESMRIRFKDRDYEIVYIDNFKFKGTDIVLKGRFINSEHQEEGDMIE